MTIGHDAKERERLKALEELEILDTDPQPDFDAVVKLAQDLFHVPVSAVSLIDRDRQWFKAIAGLDVLETPRNVAFCDHTIRSTEPLIVGDATKDSRFCSNPLVTGAPSVRFYAGVPLALDRGVNLGSLCIIDNEPREVDDDTIRRLHLLGEITVSLLKQHEMSLEVARLYETSKKQTELIAEQSAALTNQKRILDDASRIAKIGAWERNLQTGALVWSDEMFALHEMDRSDDTDLGEVMKLYPEPDRSRLTSIMEKAIREKESFCFEGRMHTVKGNLRWVRLVSQVESRNGSDVRRFGFKQDITEEKTMADCIHRLAEIDDLTGVYNRRVLHERLTAYGLAPNQTGLSLLILDLDGFKEVNDTYGHAAGDACLMQVARRLTVLGGQDTVVARLGGDEFGVIRLGDTGPDTIADFAGRLNASISRPIKWRGHAFQLSSSVGISTRMQGQTFEPNDLMREADLALYEAKNAGRSCFRSFDVSMALAVSEKAEVLKYVGKALLHEQLELYYQPKVRLSDRAHGGFEALLRINRGDGKVLTPAKFAAALEDPLLSKRIGDFVISAALDQAERWLRSHTPFHSIAINLSASQFRDAGFADDFLAEIHRRGLSPSMIQVEVTEGIFLSLSSDNVLLACRTLKNGGVKLAFDDFGTGFASLTHLRDFPVDIIKIDRSFISELASVGNATAIVNAMVSLGINLSMEVIAEGVETTAQADFLRGIGCSMAQGYLFARPMPAREATAFLKTGGARLENGDRSTAA